MTPFLSSPGQTGRPIERRSGRQDDGIVESVQLVEGYVAADLDVAEIGDVLLERHLLERTGDLLGGLVIGRDAAANETERGRQPFDNVDFAGGVRIEQRLGSVKPGRARTDDGNANRHSSIPSRRRVDRRGTLLQRTRGCEQVSPMIQGASDTSARRNDALVRQVVLLAAGA